MPRPPHLGQVVHDGGDGLLGPLVLPEVVVRVALGAPAPTLQEPRHPLQHQNVQAQLLRPCQQLHVITSWSLCAHFKATDL